MKLADRYVQEVLAKVFASDEDRARLKDDLHSHFQEAAEQGESEQQVINRLGTPDEVASSFHAERPMHYAGLWQRLVAFLGDLGVQLFLATPFVVCIAWVVLREGGRSPSWPGIILGVTSGLSIGAILLFYFPLLEARFGRSLGKHLLAIRVLREEGLPISLGQAFVRRLSLYFELLLPDALFIPFTEKKQRALDILAKTVVVREPGRDANPAGWLLCLVLPVFAIALFCLLLWWLSPTA